MHSDKNPQSILPIGGSVVSTEQLDPAIMQTDNYKMDPDNMVVIEEDDSARKEKQSREERSKSCADKDDLNVADFRLDAEQDQKLDMDSRLLDDK